MKIAAEREHMEPEKLRQLIASGRAALCANINHTSLENICAVGEGLSVKVNANIGTSSTFPDPEPELEKLEDVLDIKVLEPNASVTRELILVKIRAKDTERQAVMNATEIFRGKIVDVTHDSMVIELTGHQEKLEAFLDLISGYEILELARTGITGLTRGSADVTYLD